MRCARTAGRGVAMLAVLSGALLVWPHRVGATQGRPTSAAKSKTIATMSAPPRSAATRQRSGAAPPTSTTTSVVPATPRTNTTRAGRGTRSVPCAGNDRPLADKPRPPLPQARWWPPKLAHLFVDSDDQPDQVLIEADRDTTIATPPPDGLPGVAVSTERHGLLVYQLSGQLLWIGGPASGHPLRVTVHFSAGGTVSVRVPLPVSDEGGSRHLVGPRPVNGGFALRSQVSNGENGWLNRLDVSVTFRGCEPAVGPTVYVSPSAVD